MTLLKSINSFTNQEVTNINLFELTKLPMLYEVFHISNITDSVIEDIYQQYLELHQRFIEGTFELNPGETIFSGWAFNEFAENENEKFYKTNIEDKKHHRIFIGLYSSKKDIKASYGRFFGRGKEYKHTTMKWFDDDVLKLGVNMEFLYNKKFSGEERLRHCLAHEITHLYRSVVAPRTNLLYAKKNDIQMRFKEDLKEFKPLFDKISGDFAFYIESELYSYDFNEQDARFKETDELMKTITSNSSDLKYIRRLTIEYLRKNYNLQINKANKTLLINAISQSYSKIREITHLKVMYATYQSMDYDSDSIYTIQSLAKQFIFGYYFFQGGHLYIKDLKRRGISMKMIKEFFSRENYKTLLETQDPEKLIHFDKIYHFLDAVKESVRIAYFQYLAIIYTTIDKYLYKIYDVDENIINESELTRDVFRRYMNIDDAMFEKFEDIYMMHNSWRYGDNYRGIEDIPRMTFPYISLE